MHMSDVADDDDDAVDGAKFCHPQCLIPLPSTTTRVDNSRRCLKPLMVPKSRGGHIHSSVIILHDHSSSYITLWHLQRHGWTTHDSVSSPSWCLKAEATIYIHWAQLRRPITNVTETKPRPMIEDQWPRNKDQRPKTVGCKYIGN